MYNISRKVAVRGPGKQRRLCRDLTLGLPKKQARNRTKFPAEVSDRLEQKETFTEKLGDLQKHLPTLITDILFNSTRQNNLASKKKLKQAKCLSTEKLINYDIL